MRHAKAPSPYPICSRDAFRTVARLLAVLCLAAAGLMANQSLAAESKAESTAQPAGDADAAESTDSEAVVASEGFENGVRGWTALFSTASDPSNDVATGMTIDTAAAHRGKQSLRIEYAGVDDWRLDRESRVWVEPGRIYELRAWTRFEGEGNPALSVVLHNAKQQAIDERFAAREIEKSADWQPLRMRFAIPAGAASLSLRVAGKGAVKFSIDDLALRADGRLQGLPAKPLPTMAFGNSLIDVRFDPPSSTFTALDRRTGKEWRQRAGAGLFVTAVEMDREALRFTAIDPASLMPIAAVARIERDRPEFVVEIAGAGSMPGPLAYPLPWNTETGDLLIVPVNEGIAYPVDDPTLEPMSYVHFKPHGGLSMPWYGTTDGRRGMLELVETYSDAVLQIARLDGRLCLSTEWVSEKGQFGYARRIRYVLFDDGGYVAMAKRYRAQAKAEGLLRTMAEKRADNPNVDRLLGAASIWYWPKDEAVRVATMLKEAGIDRFIWGHATRPDETRRLNEMGALTCCYDNYQDVRNPADAAFFSKPAEDWQAGAWPKDIIFDADGHWIHGWEIKGADGKLHPCGVLCDRQAIDYARKSILEDLKTHPYTCRLMDTASAAPWHECYAVDHPTTRGEDRFFKMQLLRLASEEIGLVTGSETGHAAAVPYVHYFEGMMSLVPYRIPRAGREVDTLLSDPPPLLRKFQTGCYYRLPLWELVYHDCVVSFWFWGDYNNKFPELWDLRDLWNALYGTPPMYMFTIPWWEEHRDRFVQSYQATAPIARATACSEMLSHRWLSDDHAVQQTHFANGVKVTVNFGAKPFQFDDGTTLPPMSQKVEGLPAAD